MTELSLWLDYYDDLYSDFDSRHYGFTGAHSLPLVALKVILEPGGWFRLWASLDFLFYDWKELKKEREFFKELTEANIHIKSS